MNVAQRQASGLTLLVLRDGGKPARQLHLSRPVLMYVPLFALLSISSLIISLQVKSGQTIGDLQRQLADHELTLEAVVSDKEEAIRRLQSQVINLSQQSSEVKNRMSRITELETQLEQFLGESTAGASNSKLTSLQWNPEQNTHGEGGEFIAVHDNQFEKIAQVTEDDFEEIKALMDEMTRNIPVALQRARARQEETSGTISAWPTPSRRITSSFGYRSDPFSGRAAFHSGLDIGGNIGDPVYAAAAGKVIHVQEDGSRGKYIIIRHLNGLETWYLHLNKASISEGDTVTKGQAIGELGNTGRSTGAHLHFQVMKQNEPVDPLPYIK